MDRFVERRAERKEMHKLALSIVLTSQGISFLHAGTEFLRSKKAMKILTMQATVSMLSTGV